MEQKTEFKVLIGFGIILCCNVLGVDIQQIILLLSDAEQYTKDIRELVASSADKETSLLVAGITGTAYTVCRSWLKNARENRENGEKPLDTDAIVEAMADRFLIKSKGQD